MTTAARQERRDQSAFTYYPAMLNMAGELECELTQAPENPTMLRGVCPFHETKRGHAQQNFIIDAKSCRFSCQACGAKGNAITFAAMVWGVNVTDAHTLLQENGGRVTVDRPPFAAAKERNGERPPLPHINSAVLTRASAFYAEQIYTSYPALQTLARMGIRPEAAADAGVGYCPGRGLEEYLREKNGVYEDEIAGSRLFSNNGSTETFAGRITLTDRDYTGGALWMTSIAPEDDPERPGFRGRRPVTYGIPGARPHLFGQYSVDRNADYSVVTDDARLYIVLAAKGYPVILLTKRQYEDTNLELQCDIIANRLTRRNIRKFVLALHERANNRMLADMLKEKQPETPVINLTKGAFMSQLDPATRDIDAMLNMDPEGPGKPARGNRRRNRRNGRAGDQPEDRDEPEATPQTEPETKGESQGSSC